MLEAKDQRHSASVLKKKKKKSSLQKSFRRPPEKNVFQKIQDFNTSKYSAVLEPRTEYF